MNELQTSLSKCRIEGSTLFLPKEMLSNYKEVRQALINAGASYKRNTFVFPNDAQPFIDRLMGGESVNIKKEFQFFPTPDEIADYLVELADINKDDLILEPSAGQGAIVKAINRVLPDKIVMCIELMPENRNILENIKTANVMDSDFLNLESAVAIDSCKRKIFTKIIANPPFNKCQDQIHIRKMYDCLKPGGRLVSISSKHWQLSQNKKETEFRNWLKEVNADVQEIEAGAFKESGTMISSLIIIIDKK